jgi:hypothetical protein
VLPSLLKANAEVNAEIHYSGKTALIEAINSGHNSIALALIEAKADVDAQTQTGWSPLKLASFLTNSEMTRALITAGSDVNVKDNEGRTALFWAALKGNAEIVQLLIEGGAEIQSKDNFGYTALILAEANGHSAVAKLLRSKKSNPQNSGEQSSGGE